MRAKSGTPMSAPKVYAVAKSRCQAQSSSPQMVFGLPKSRISRSIQGNPSEIAVPAGVVTAKATASGPASRIRAAVQSSASSQVIRVQPGSGSPFGRVRRIG